MYMEEALVPLGLSSLRHLIGANILCLLGCAALIFFGAGE